jgi:hypothetical protein
MLLRTGNHELLEELEVHVLGTPEIEFARARRDFSYLGFAKVPFLVPETMKQAVAADVMALVDTSSVRREMLFKETDYTPRRMRNVRRAEIFERASVIPDVYYAQPLLNAMRHVVGEPVHACPYEPEQCVITRLEKDGDTHGWHWDDYSFALVWVIEAPAAEDGGFVQCVPRTAWDKESPRINRAFVSRPIYSMELFPGDLYLMRTDTTLHRVYPLKAGQRTIINMAFASTNDLQREMSHETMDSLWAEPIQIGA